MGAPPSYESYVAKKEWALRGCSMDPAMQRSFRDAGAVDGWVSGPALRRYCEKQGYLTKKRTANTIAKSTLAAAWDLADVSRDIRGLSFDEFCVFMHLICIATAGGVLPPTLPAELVPPTEEKNDEEIARALQAAYDEQVPPPSVEEEPPPPPVETSPPRRVVALGQENFDLAALRSLALAQGGLLEMEGVLFACDEAVENERWAPGSGFASQHLLPTDVAMWSSDDGSVSASDRSFVAPPRDPRVWQLVADWQADIDETLAKTDPYGWTYCRGLPSPLAPGVPFAAANKPFAGAVARRRKWTRLSCRSLRQLANIHHQQHMQQQQLSSQDNKKNNAPALLARLQDGFRVGVSEFNRRFATTRLGQHGGSPSRSSSSSSLASDDSGDTPQLTPEQQQKRAREKWDTSGAGSKCRSFIGVFVEEFPAVMALSDEARANAVKKFIAHCAGVLRKDRMMQADDFDLVVDEMEADLYTRLRDGKFDLVQNESQTDVAFAERMARLQPVTAAMLDATDVEALDVPHWDRAVAALRTMPDALTPRRKVANIRSAVDDIFQCLAVAHRRRKKDEDLDDVPPGADDLLPVVILATLRARTPTLFAQLKFIELYVGDDRLSGEEGFLLTQLVAAASFLLNVDATQLKGMTTDAFNALFQDLPQPDLMSFSSSDESDDSSSISTTTNADPTVVDDNNNVPANGNPPSGSDDSGIDPPVTRPAKKGGTLTAVVVTTREPSDDDIDSDEPKLTSL